MLRLQQVITITQQPSVKYPNRNKTLHFTFSNFLEVIRSADNFTQTAKVILPRNLKYNNEDISIYQSETKEPLIMRSDAIVIEVGYSPNIEIIFKGWISRISNDVPMELECEDDMWILKQAIIDNYSKNNTTLSNLIANTIALVVPDMPIKVIKAEGLNIRVQKASVGVMLDALRTNFGFYSFFVPSSNRELNDVLHIGLPFYEPKKTETFLIEKVFVESDLQYVRKDDVKIKVLGIIITAESRTEYSFGDADGDLRTVYQYGGTYEELKRLCEQYLDEYNYDGYVGNFTTFLEPIMNPGDHAIINSYQYPERSGTYLIKSTTQSVGIDGGRQIIELEKRIL